MTVLKPVSEKMRALLSLLGETPEQHQKQVLALQAKKEKPRKREKPEEELRRNLNKELLHRMDTERETPATIIERFQPENLVANAYVLFERKLTCKNCGRSDRAQAHSQLFVRKHKLPRDAERTQVYFPVAGIENPLLPRLVQVSFSTTPVCLHCFEEAACLKINEDESNAPAQTLPSPEQFQQANTALSAQEKKSTGSGSEGESSSLRDQLLSLFSSTQDTADGSIPTVSSTAEAATPIPFPSQDMSELTKFAQSEPAIALDSGSPIATSGSIVLNSFQEETDNG